MAWISELRETVLRCLLRTAVCWDYPVSCAVTHSMRVTQKHKRGGNLSSAELVLQAEVNLVRIGEREVACELLKHEAETRNGELDVARGNFWLREDCCRS